MAPWLVTVLKASTSPKPRESMVPAIRIVSSHGEERLVLRGLSSLAEADILFA